MSLTRIQPEQIFGYLVGVVGTMLPFAAYTSASTRDLFGDGAELKLSLLCGVGAALGLALGRGPGRRLVSFIVGAFAGVGGVLVYLTFGARMHAVLPWLFPLRWPAVVFLCGALPVLALLSPLDRLSDTLDSRKRVRW